MSRLIPSHDFQKPRQNFKVSTKAFWTQRQARLTQVFHASSTLFQSFPRFPTVFLYPVSVFPDLYCWMSNGPNRPDRLWTSMSSHSSKAIPGWENERYLPMIYMDRIWNRVVCVEPTIKWYICITKNTNRKYFWWIAPLVSCIKYLFLCIFYLWGILYTIKTLSNWKNFCKYPTAIVLRF